MNWLLILLIVALLAIVIKIAHFKTKIILTIVIVTFLFFYVSFSLITKDEAVNLNTARGVIDAGKIYLSWFGQAFNNMRTITANVIGLDWLPENKTIEDLKPSNVMRG